MSWRAGSPSWRRGPRRRTTSKGFPRSSASASDALIEALLSAPARLGGVRVLAIDGPSGAGKSTLAARAVADLRARGYRTELVSTDAFATWDDPVSWWPRLADGVLRPLANGVEGAYRRMDWAGGTPPAG